LVNPRFSNSMAILLPPILRIPSGTFFK